MVPQKSKLGFWVFGLIRISITLLLRSEFSVSLGNLSSVIVVTNEVGCKYLVD